MSETRDSAPDCPLPIPANPSPSNAVRKPIGRPSDYSPEIAATICQHIAAGMKTREIAALEDMPSQQTIYTWLYRHDGFLERWQRAREASAEALGDQAINIADDTSQDVLHDQHGRPMPNMAAVKRAELRVNQRHWLMGKWSKRYADKVEINGTIEVKHELGSRLDAALRHRRQAMIDMTPDKT